MMMIMTRQKESGKMTWKMKLAFFAMMAFFFSTPAWALEVKEVSFADEVTLNKTVLAITGAAVLKWAMLFDVYAGALYLPEDVPGEKWAEDVPKKLELSYFREIEAQGFADASDKILKEGLSAKEYERLSERLKTFYGFFQDVRPGDRYSINYSPGQGTELKFNGQGRGSVQGADFAVAYFGIWLGESPINKKFRDRLLGAR